MKLFALIAIHFLSLSVANASKLSGSERLEIRCLLLKEAEACHLAFLRHQKNVDGMQFSQFGCEELNSPQSCVDLGDWYLSNKVPDDAEKLFAKACPKFILGCARMVDLRRQQFDSISNPFTDETLAEVESLVTKICASEADAKNICEKSKAQLAEFKHARDPNYGTCQMKYRIFQTEKREDISSLFGEAKTLSDLVTKDQCSLNCKTWVSGFRPTDPGQLQLRGQCYFSDKPLDKIVWRPLNVESTCSQKGQAVGLQDDLLYERCYCEQKIYQQANDNIEGEGAYARAETSYSKKIGNSKWFRCSLGVYFDDPLEVKSNRSLCEKKVQKIKQALKSEQTIQSLELNFQSLNCTSAAESRYQE